MILKSKKQIEMHVLSTVKWKWRNINSESCFPLYTHSLKSINGDKFINKVISKIEHEEHFTEKELLMISLLCFTKTTNDIEHTILNSAEIITNIPSLKKDLGQFAKGIVLMLCDKFVKDKQLNKRITNLVGGNMKNVEEYAKEYAKNKVNEQNENIIIKLQKKGFTIDEIIETLNVEKDFVEQTLSN